MSIEEKIEEAAEHYIDNCVEVTNCECAWQTVDDAFKEGANFALEEAFRWHDPAKEEPINNPLILKIEDGGYCEYRVGWYLEHKYRGWGFYTYPEPDVDFLVTGVVGYRPINLEDL